MKQPRTLNNHVGRKLLDKCQVEIMNEVTRKLNSVIAVQVLYEILRVTFKTDEAFRAAKQHKDIYLLFSFDCSILGGGPPATPDPPPPSNANADLTEHLADADQDSMADVSLSHVDDPSAGSCESESDTSDKDSIVEDNNTSVVVCSC